MDFDGDVMFNSVNAAANANPQSASHQEERPEASIRQEEKQLAPRLDPSRARHNAPPLTSVHQNIDPNLSTTDVIKSQLAIVHNEDQTVIRKDSNTYPPEVDLRLHAESLHSVRTSSVDMENFKRQQQHEAFSHNDARISPNLAAATVSNMKIVISDDHCSNPSRNRNHKYRVHHNQSITNQHQPAVTLHDGNNALPSTLRLNNRNKGVLQYNPEGRLMLQKDTNTQQLQPIQQQQHPTTIMYRPVAQFHEQKNAMKIEYVQQIHNKKSATAERDENINQRQFAGCVQHIPETQEDLNVFDEAVGQGISRVPTSVNHTIQAGTGKATNNAQNSQLVQLLRTNNKRAFEPAHTAFEPNKKLLLSAHQLSEASQINPGDVQTYSGGFQTFSNDGRDVTQLHRQGVDSDNHHNVFKLPVPRQQGQQGGKNVATKILQTSDLQHTSIPVSRSQGSQILNEEIRQTPFSGQFETHVPKHERQTYLMQRQKELKPEQHFLVKQEYLERQHERLNVSQLAIPNEINEPRLMVTTQQSSNLVRMVQAPQVVKSEIGDSSLMSSSRHVPPKNTDFGGSNPSILNPRQLHNRILGVQRNHPRTIPHPRESEIQQSEITLLKNNIIDASVANCDQSSKGKTKQKHPSYGHQEERASRQNSRGNKSLEQHHKHKRDVHINAEQNRRTSLKTGFDGLKQIIPGLNDHGK